MGVPSGKFPSPLDMKTVDFDSVLVFYYYEVLWVYCIYFLLWTSFF